MLKEGKKCVPSLNPANQWMMMKMLQMVINLSGGEKIQNTR